MAAQRWIMIDLADQKIVHVGVCMYEHLQQVPCPSGFAVVVAATGDRGQYWNGTGPQDDPPNP